MKRATALATLLATALVSTAADYRPDLQKKLGFPIYTNNPPGKQLINDTVRAAAPTPALAPEETRQKIAVPPGFEVRLFASEPEVVNPVAMTWDERGRLWVLELYEYPKGATKGAQGRDRIKILEDTDNDGAADKVTVFADGFSLAEGMALGNGGVYVGAPPNLYFLRDTNNDDKADTQEVLLTGFGNEDRHELLNGFAWGPDGWLYMTHGVFTHSNVRAPKTEPNAPEDSGVRMDAALARYHPVTKKFEVFADGTSNPWGVDWNERGDAFVSACVIQHLFHLAPGGLYNRQGGTWPNPYGYVQDLPTKGLPAIVDWRHYRAAHAGICVYQGDQWPAAWRGLVFLGNIHEKAINCDRLTPVGATYKADRETNLLGAYKGVHQMGGGNFFASADPWVMPVSLQTGPDGAMWVMDWYDKYPCYQNAQADPDGVDREHGRIWRVVWVGDQPGKVVGSRRSTDMPSTRESSQETTKTVMSIDNKNSWVKRTAQRLLTERKDPAARGLLDHYLFATPSGQFPVLPENRLSFLWTVFSCGLADDGVLDRCASDQQVSLRAAAARVTGERGDAATAALTRLNKLATDSDASVRAAVATAVRQFTSSSLTIDATARSSTANADVTSVLRELLARPSVEGDFYYPHIVWMAMEPRVAADPQPFFPLIAANENSVSAYCARRVMRRICDLTNATARVQHLNAAMTWLGELAPKTQLAAAALDGLIEAAKSKGAPPTTDLAPIFAKLTANPALADKAQRLAAAFGDKSAARLLIARINDPKAGTEERLRGISAAREAKTDAARDELLKLIKAPLASVDASLKTEAVAALAAFGGYEYAYPVIDTWKEFAPATRVTAAETLVRSTKSARALIAGVEKGVVLPRDISATARRTLAQSEDSTIADSADRLLGKYRKPGADKLKLIDDKKNMILNGTADLKNGYEVAKRTCYVCHKFYGEGADVGPELTGVGRSSLDSLLHNIIDPNEVIGAGYETTEVELKDDTTISGRVVEESDTRIKLLASGPSEHTLAKSDIKLMNGKPAIRKTTLSLMPEGLEQIPDKDFRDLVMFILNPPQDNRPWTPALRKELLGIEDKKSADARTGADDFRGKGAAQHDGESVALWNPDWRVTCTPFDGAPKKLVEFAGRKNVLLTHPASRTAPAMIERTLAVPRGQRTTLSLFVAADDRGDWELRASAEGKELKRQIIDKSGERWKRVEIDLTPFAGKTIPVRLENAANDWNFEFGYWSDVEVRTTEQAAKR